MNRKLAALSRVLTYAKSRQWINTLPHIERLKEPKERIRWYSDDELDTIVAWFNSVAMEDMADLVLFAVDSGLRLGELLRLTHRDVVNGLTVVTEAKSGHPRSVPQTAGLKVMMVRRKGSPDDCVFDFNADYIQARWTRCCSALGKEGDTGWIFHTLRHTFIARLVQCGQNLRVVQQLAGHSSLLVTQRYAHLSPVTLTDAMKALDHRTPIRTDPTTSNHTSQQGLQSQESSF